MKTHTSTFKNQIKELGRQLDSIVTYTQNGETIELGMEQLNSITPVFESNILKSAMKELDIESKIEIPIGTILNYQYCQCRWLPLHPAIWMLPVSLRSMSHQSSRLTLWLSLR